MKASHFNAEHLPSRDGYTWTLPTRLSALLCEAEQLYGERDRNYTMVGVEFAPDGPHIWYPGSRNHIAIQLAPNALEDTALAVYQLGHETIHLLSPTGKADAPLLEEGLATAFAEDVAARIFSRTGMTPTGEYANAAALVRRLLQYDAQAILKLRAQEPCFARMTAEHFAAALPALDRALVQQLLTRFSEAR